MIIARVESLIMGKGYKDALERAYAYINSGADGIMIHSKNKDTNELKKFCDLYNEFDNRKPLIVVPTTDPNVSGEELIEKKFKMIIYANQTLRASYSAMNNTLKEIINSDKISDIKQEITSMEKIFELQEMYEIKNQEKNIEEDLKKMGYIDEWKNTEKNFSIF